MNFKEVIVLFHADYIYNKPIDRPIILSDNGFRCLLDTGAEYNMWFLDKSTFKRYGGFVYEDVHVPKQMEGIDGVGIDVQLATLDLSIKRIIWNKCHMFIPVTPIPKKHYDAILSVTLFKNIDLTTSIRTRKVTFDLRGKAYDSLTHITGENSEISLIDGEWIERKY